MIFSPLFSLLRQPLIAKTHFLVGSSEGKGRKRKRFPKETKSTLTEITMRLNSFKKFTKFYSTNIKGTECILEKLPNGKNINTKTVHCLMLVDKYLDTFL